MPRPRSTVTSVRPFESLENRRLMAAAPLGVDAVDVAWNGQVHQARPNSYVARFDNLPGNAGQQLGAVNALLARTGKGITATRQLGEDGVFQLAAPAGAGRAAEVRAAVNHLPGFKFLEPDFVLTTRATTPNDSYFAGHQYALHNTGQTGGTVDADIDATEAWDLTTGSSSVVVGVIDSGVDYNHPDLAGNIWTNPGEVAGDGLDNDANGYVDDVRGWDFFNRDNNPMDDNGHGTHVAGTIAARGNNAAGVTGVNWNAQVIPLKFLGADGTGYLSDAVSAINYATNLKLKGVNVRVTNNSWGGGGAYSSALFDAIKRHGEAGIVFVAAAGNGGADQVGDDNDVVASYPSNYNLPNVVAVAATDHNDVLGSFSNYGATQVDLAAPGVNILSTMPGGGYGFMSGTSMASPHVAGATALAFAHNPDATVQTVRDALLGGADRVATLTGKVVTGGRLNAFNTVTRVSPVTTPTPTPTPAPAPTVTVPAAPASLSARALSRSQISLSWSDRSTNETGFAIDVSTDGGRTFTRLGTVGANSTGATISGLSANRTYHFRVLAYNDAGNSAFSNVASAKTRK